MTFEIAFKRWLLFPGPLRFGEENPRPSGTQGKPHYAGREIDGLLVNRFPGGPDKNPGQGGDRDEQGYLELRRISLGSVQDAYTFYEKQLIPVTDDVRVRKDHFYLFPLRQKPRALFGRVKVCYPMDGYLEDIEELELMFPKAGGKPVPVRLEPGNINPQKQIKGYRIGIKIFGTEQDHADFARHERKFTEAGFAPDFGKGLFDLLDLQHADDASLPWFQVISSGWFAGFSPNLQDEIRACVWNLSRRETRIMNYHPAHTYGNARKLNDELDYTYGLGDYYLTDPKTPEQVLQMVRTIFEKLFVEPARKPELLSNRQKAIE